MLKLLKLIFWPHFPKAQNKPDFKLYKTSILGEYETNNQVSYLPTFIFLNLTKDLKNLKQNYRINSLQLTAYFAIVQFTIITKFQLSNLILKEDKVGLDERVQFCPPPPT